MAELKRRHAGVALSLNVGNSEAVLRQLADYHADVGVTAKRPSEPRFHAIPYRRDRLIVFVPRGHALAGRGSLPVRALEGLDMVLREPGSVTRAVFEHALAEAGVRVGAIMDIDGREAVREAVASGPRHRRRLRARIRARRPLRRPRRARREVRTSANTWSAWKNDCA